MSEKDYELIREEINQCLYHGEMSPLAEIARKLLEENKNYKKALTLIKDITSLVGNKL